MSEGKAQNTIDRTRSFIGNALNLVAALCAILWILAYVLTVVEVKRTGPSAPPFYPGIISLVGFVFTFPPAILCALIALILVGPRKSKVALISLCPFVLSIAMVFAVAWHQRHQGQVRSDKFRKLQPDDWVCLIWLRDPAENGRTVTRAVICIKQDHIFHLTSYADGKTNEVSGLLPADLFNDVSTSAKHSRFFVSGFGVPQYNNTTKGPHPEPVQKVLDFVLKQP